MARLACASDPLASGALWEDGGAECGVAAEVDAGVDDSGFVVGVAATSLVGRFPAAWVAAVSLVLTAEGGVTWGGVTCSGVFCGGVTVTGCGAGVAARGAAAAGWGAAAGGGWPLAGLCVGAGRRGEDPPLPGTFRRSAPGRERLPAHHAAFDRPPAPP